MDPSINFLDNPSIMMQESSVGEPKSAKIRNIDTQNSQDNKSQMKNFNESDKDSYLQSPKKIFFEQNRGESKSF